MGRSFFMINSAKHGAVKLQFRKMWDEIGSCSLSLEGPFADHKNALAGIAEDVRKRMLAASDASPLLATILTLAPQNAPISEASWLKPPFIISFERSGNDIRDSAGVIASSKPVTGDAGTFRQADPDDLELLGVAILRRLGIPCFYSFAHLEETRPAVLINAGAAHAVSAKMGTSVPCINVVDGDVPMIYSMRPPFVFGSMSNLPISSIEMLDDNALLSIIKMKVASLAAESLMRDVASSGEDFHGEGRIRAAAIGHTLHKSSLLWTPDEVNQARLLSTSLLNLDGAEGMVSARDISEYRYVHDILCPVHHIEKAASIILSDEAKSAAKGLDVLAAADNQFSKERFLAVMEQHPSVQRLVLYMTLTTDIGDHLHSSDRCPDLKAAN